MPTENRSRNTEMVSVPPFIGLEPLIGRYYPAKCRRCGWVGSSEELTEGDAQCTRDVGDRLCLGECDELDRDNLLNIIQAMAQQHQGEPVWYMNECGLSVIHAKAKARLDEKGLDTSSYPIPLYTHADPAEVERLNSILRAQRTSLDICAGQIENLQAMLAEAHGMLRHFAQCADARNVGSAAIAYVAALPASQGPAAQVEDPTKVEHLRDQLKSSEIELKAVVAEHDESLSRLAEAQALLLNAGPDYMDDAELLSKLRALLSASAEPSAPVMQIPEGYCVMPRKLTAENGAKALLIGEFKLETTHECPECAELEEPAEGCEICDGAGEYEQPHTIPWDQIKLIYSEAVKGLALKQ